jgi:hypothetical protein
MKPRIKDVTPNDDYTVNLVFDNGEEKMFDVASYLDKGIFKEIKIPAASSGVLEQRQLPIFVQLLISVPLMFNISTNHIFIAMFTNTTCKVPITPKFPSP